MFFASVLLLYVALSAALGWWLRHQLAQTDLPDWVETSVEAGWFSSGITLSTRAGAPLAGRFQGQLQHGPLLREPWQAALLRLNGLLRLAGNHAALQNNSAVTSSTGTTSSTQPGTPTQPALKVMLQSGFSGHTAASISLPHWLDSSRQPLLAGGPATGDLSIQAHGSSWRGSLQHAHGRLCRPDFNIHWRELDWRWHLDNANNWLQSGGVTLAADMLALTPADSCQLDDVDRHAAAAVSIATPGLQLDWPQQSTIGLRLEITAWHAAGDNIGPVLVELTLQNMDRAALSSWSQALIAHQQQTATAPANGMLQLALAAQTAELLRQRPLLRLHQLHISTRNGDFDLAGDIQLRPGGVQAELHGQTNADAARLALTVLLQDQTAAERMLLSWRRQGLVQELDERWLIDVVVNR